MKYIKKINFNLIDDEKKDFNNELRNEIYDELMYFNTAGLIRVLITIYNLKDISHEYKEGDL